MTYPHTRTSRNLQGLLVHQFGDYPNARAEVLVQLHNNTDLRVQCPSESAAMDLLRDCASARHTRTRTGPHFDGTDLHGDDIYHLEARSV